MTDWRLLSSGNGSASGNMAIDEALLRCFDPQISRPVLRFYGWNRPALSLGRFQQAAEILSLEHCGRDTLPLVRRITGGGVIYHGDEITYSIVCAPHQLPTTDSIKDAYRVLTGFLLAWYRRRGLDARYAVDLGTDAASLGVPTPYCFAGRESFDILIDGKKIGGNAQRRLKQVIFQHGSLPLKNRAVRGHGYMRDQSSALAGTTTSLEEQGISGEVQQLEQELAEEFCCQLGCTVTADGLTSQESGLAELLARGKYSSEQWNREGREG